MAPEKTHPDNASVEKAEGAAKEQDPHGTGPTGSGDKGEATAQPTDDRGRTESAVNGRHSGD